jgi:YggT family protein
LKSGGAEGDRTPDLRIANATLSQLSYGPVSLLASATIYGDRSIGCQAQPKLDPAAACGRGWLPLPSVRHAPARRAAMPPLIHLLSELIWIYEVLLIAQAVMSWLLAFGVINRYNRAVAVIGDFLYRITEPALRPIRNFLPNFGGIDISPIVLIFLLELIREELVFYLG